MGVMAAKRRQNRRLRQASIGLGLCLLFYYIFFVSGTSDYGLGSDREPGRGGGGRGRLPARVLNSLSLTEKQCTEAFPGLTQSIDDIIDEGPFRVKDGGDLGPVQARIKDGKIYILNAQRRVDLSTEMLNSRAASLQQLHRALITSPEPIPDTIFTLNFQDQPFGTSWGYSRAANPVHRGQGPDDRNFLMPHFSFWAWKLPFIRSMGRAAAAIDAIEEAYPTLAYKIPKAVWRGTSWYNSVHSPRLRQSLLATTRAKPWADVEALTWVGENATNAIPVEDFCRYRYVLHTEGVAYSGRFQFLQLCGSVVLTPPIQWMQHTTHFVRPVFAVDIPGLEKAGSKESHAARDRAKKFWPRPYPATEANIIFVAPDWSNLEETVAWLEAHPDIAQGIARRQRDVYAGGGYFSPAAEVCYWRALVRGWSKVARIDEDEWRGKEGVTFEAFAVNNE